MSEEQPVIFKTDGRPDGKNDNTRPQPDREDAHFKESLARLTAQLAARNPRAATGEPPLRRPPSAPTPPQPPRARMAEPPVVPPRPTSKPAPQDVIREVVRARAPEPPP